MPNPAMTETQVKKILKRYESLSHLTVADAAKKMGLTRRTLQRYLNVLPQRFGIDPPQKKNPLTIAYGSATRPAVVQATHEIPELPDDDLPVEEIIEMRKREFAQKKAHEEATKLIPIKIKVNGPIGILHFGDPHLDDDGTDIGAAFRHAELTRTVEGLFGANVGDTNQDEPCCKGNRSPENGFWKIGND